jgi:hypothetical protein
MQAFMLLAAPEYELGIKRGIEKISLLKFQLLRSIIRVMQHIVRLVRIILELK